MKKHVLVMIVALAAWAGLANAAVFLDDFNTNTASDYTYSDSYGSGGSFNVSGGTLNIDAAAGNTASAMRTTAVPFAVGEWLGIDAAGPGTAGFNVFLMLSTTAAQPNGTSSYGIRLAREATAGLRTKIYPGGAQPSVPDPDLTIPATLWINRVSDTVFDS